MSFMAFQVFEYLMLVSLGARKRTIRYQRPTPPVPATYTDVRLPEEYTTTTNNEQLLQYDNGQNAETEC
jgi:hypothetical protein